MPSLLEKNTQKNTSDRPNLAPRPESVYDSVALLENYMAESWPNAQAMTQEFRPEDEKEDELDSVGLLERYMAESWPNAKDWSMEFLPKTA